MRIPRSASIEQSSVSATTTPESWTDFFTGIRRAELYPRTREALAPSTSCNLTMAETSIDGTRVTTLELFFDLVFVFTITQLTAVLYHAPTLRALAQVVLMLGVIWWMYGGYAWMTNAVSAHTTNRRLLLLGGMGGYFVLALAVAFEWLTPVIRGLRGFGIAPAHFVERHGLVVIVAIGESVVAVGIGASHLPVDGALVLAAALGLALSACLWWLYFGGDDERAVRALAGMDPVRRARGALVGYGYAHLPLLLGIVTIASAKRRGFEHPFTTFSWTRAAILGGGGQHLPRGRRPLAEGAGARARRSTDGGDSPRPRDGSARRDRLPRRPDRRARRAPRPRDRSGERMDMTDAHALTSHLVLFSHLGLTHPNRTRLLGMTDSARPRPSMRRSRP